MCKPLSIWGVLRGSRRHFGSALRGTVVPQRAVAPAVKIEVGMAATVMMVSRRRRRITKPVAAASRGIERARDRLAVQRGAALEPLRPVANALAPATASLLSRFGAHPCHHILLRPRNVLAKVAFVRFCRPGSRLHLHLPVL